MNTFQLFLTTKAFANAANSGNTAARSYRLDDEPCRVGLHFSGHYTLLEVEAQLADLRRVQLAWTLFRAQFARTAGED